MIIPSPRPVCGAESLVPGPMVERGVAVGERGGRRVESSQSVSHSPAAGVKCRDCAREIGPGSRSR